MNCLNSAKLQKIAVSLHKPQHPVTHTAPAYSSLDLTRIREFIGTHEWHFAKTMPQIPHWYCLRKDKGDIEEFTWFARAIQEHSVPGQF